jgi:uncharacterized RDD family membrane protein YckC
VSTQDPYQPPTGSGWNADPYAQQPSHPSFASYGATTAYPPAGQYGVPAYGAQGYDVPSYGAAAYGSVPLPVYTGWGTRVGAYMIDSLAVIPMYIGEFVFASTGDAVGTPGPAGALAYLVGFLVTVGLWIWNRGYLGGVKGQSLGKRVVKSRLALEINGEPVGMGKALLRDVTHLVDGILYIGYLRPLWHRQRQTFADTICSTVVVS